MNEDELNSSCAVESFSNAINISQLYMDINKREGQAILSANKLVFIIFTESEQFKRCE